ncbi:unnamed protein product, partial [Adineta steineri]
RFISMTTLTESNNTRRNCISSRLIILSLNIHIELSNGRFSLTRSNEVRKQSDLSLISSSFSNSLIDELFTCIEYYCDEINKLIDELRLINTNSYQILDDLSKGCQICLNVLYNYHHDRISAVQSLLSNPFREDVWHFVYEIDSNIFSKCRIILIRLRIYFLLLHQFLTNDKTRT